MNKKLGNRARTIVLTLILCIQICICSNECLFAEASGNIDGVMAQEIIIPKPYEDLSLYAQSAVLIDGDTNRILYAKNADTQMPNASTTKILTCILAIELGEMNQVCAVSDYARSMPETKCGFYKGDAFFLKDLLYSLMLESHNDSAVVIAETIGGSVEGFAELMNEKAREIGCTSTHFITPNGLDGEDEEGIHGTSAYDLALLMNYCRKNETFLEITRAQSHSFSDIEGKHTYTVNNKNSFLSMQSGALTGKTGYTSKAGYCYVGAYQENNVNYTYALLACGWPNHKTYKWQDARALIGYGNDYYEVKKIGDETMLYDIDIPMGISIDEEGFTYQNTTTVKNIAKQWEMLIGENDVIDTSLQLEAMTLPIKENEKAGTLYYYINGYYAGEQEVFYTENIYKQDLWWCLAYFMKEFLQKASF